MPGGGFEPPTRGFSVLAVSAFRVFTDFQYITNLYILGL